MMLANGLRGTAVIIAVLGLLDPAVSLPWPPRPRVRVLLAEPHAESGLRARGAAAQALAQTQIDRGAPAATASDTNTATNADVVANADATASAAVDADADSNAVSEARRALAQRVRERLAREFDVVPDATRRGDAAGAGADAAPATTDRAVADGSTDAYVVVGMPEDDLPPLLLASAGLRDAANNAGATPAAPRDATTANGAQAGAARGDAAKTGAGSTESAARSAASGAGTPASDAVIQPTHAAPVIVAVTPASAAGTAAASVRVLSVDAPRSVHIAGRVRFIVSLDARGMRGRASVIAVRADGLTLARVTHAWTRQNEQTRVTLDATPLRTGLTQFIVTADDAPRDAAPATSSAGSTRSAGSVGSTGESSGAASSAGTAAGATPTADAPRPADAPAAPAASITNSPAASADTIPAADGTRNARHSRVDVAVDVTDQPRRVLFVEPRPSWTTRFIRLALAGDPRFRIDARAQVSRGLAARTAEAPVTLTAATLAPFDAVVVGAPEQLTAADVEALSLFARARGGLIVFAPDRLPQGPYVALLPAESFDERLLETPASVTADSAAPAATSSAASSGGGADAAAGAGAGRLLAGLPLLAGELAIPRTLRPGAVPLATLGGDAGARAVILASPLGNGQVLFAGALDAWRYRDRPAARFDAFWRQAVFALGVPAPPVEITFEPAIARPGEPVTVRAVWRRDLLPPAHATAAGSASDADGAADRMAPDGWSATVGARLAPLSAARPGSSVDDAADAAAGGEAIRLWPGDRPGEFHATLNAPTRDGVYAMSLNADSPSTSIRAPLLVSRDVRRAPRSWEALRARVEAQGGLIVPDDQLDRAVDHLRQQTTRPGRTPRHPWRSAWWIIPFAGCLGGEWLLRRRRGDA